MTESEYLVDSNGKPVELGEDFVPYDPENPAAFLTQIEAWNDACQYSRCLLAMEMIPDYEWSTELNLLRVRALENLGILGDADAGTTPIFCKKQMEKALEFLMQFVPSEEDLMPWVRRITVAFYYLDRYPEARMWAERWVEMDPEDEYPKNIVMYSQMAMDKEQQGESEPFNDGSEGEDDTASSDSEEGMFIGFALQSEPALDLAKFFHDLETDWQLVRSDDADEDDEHAAVFMIGNTMASIALMPGRIPHQEAERHAENNFYWPEGVEVAQAHQSHLLVTIVKTDLGLLEKGQLFVKLFATALKQPHVTAAHVPGILYSPEMYCDFATIMKDGDLPVFNWVWCGFERVEDGLVAYTDGMGTFGKREMEIVVPEERLESVDLASLNHFLRDIVYYVLSNDVTFQDNETLGLSETDIHQITISPGLVVTEDDTIKISY